MPERKPLPPFIDDIIQDTINRKPVNPQQTLKPLRRDSIQKETRQESASNNSIKFGQRAPIIRQIEPTVPPRQYQDTIDNDDDDDYDSSNEESDTKSVNSKLSDKSLNADNNQLRKTIPIRDAKFLKNQINERIKDLKKNIHL